MSFSTPNVPSVQMPQPSSTALSPAAPVGQKPKAKSSGSTFIGAAQTPQPQDLSKKTLLGQ